MKKFVVVFVFEIFVLITSGFLLDSAMTVNNITKKSTAYQPIVMTMESEPDEEEKINIVSPYTDDEIYLMALVTVAEAEGECEYGQRLVIDTILNRVDSEKFPDTVNDVVYQKNQFTSMWNGRIDRCTVTDYFIQLVKDECQNRSNSEVVFFRTERYSDYGTPLFVVQDHYFSAI